MIKICNKADCCGCGACAQACPKSCISLKQDNEGFLYPIVNENLCIDCKLCEKVCPVLHPYEARVPIHSYAAINLDEQIRMESSSGGVFTFLAEQVIKDGGVVFGARYDENWQVVLDYTETLEGLASFRGSKYLQARTADTYSQCSHFLKEGRKVLFSGTPCQITGLRHFLRRDFDNLLVVDFVCHGVSSPKVWEKYLQEIAGIDNVKNVSMRDKSREGWKRFNFVLNYKRGNNVVTLSTWHKENDFMKAFLCNMILRPSCYECKAKECRSHSDITIGDFWRIRKVCPHMNDDKGTSLVLVHTQKGMSYLSVDTLQKEEVSFEDCVRSNRTINVSARPWPRREEFFAGIDTAESIIDHMRLFLKPTRMMILKKCALSVKKLPKKIFYKLIKLSNGR